MNRPGCTRHDYYAAHAPIDMTWANLVLWRRMNRNAEAINEHYTARLKELLLNAGVRP